MLKLRGGTVTHAAIDEIFRELFPQKLPLTVRTALAVDKDASLSELADMADNMAEVQDPQAPVYQLLHQGDSEITAIKTELQKIWKALHSPSSAREEPQSRSQPDICWYYERFGAKALKCREPCKFQQPQGNSTTSR